MIQWKKYMGGTLGVLLAASLLTGCGSGGGNDSVAYLNYDDNDAFASTIRESFKEGAAGQNMNVEIYDAKRDGNTQLDQFKSVIASGTKQIVLLAVDGKSIAPVVDEAIDSGVTIVAINRDLSSDKPVMVTSDNKEAGKLQGEYMARHLPPGAKVVYLEGTGTQSSARNRWEGFKEACLNKRSDIQLLGMQDANYNRAEAMKTMALWLTLFPQIDAVVCGNDEMALGAVAALKAAGRLQGCMVSGVDATPDALNAVDTGEMVQTVKQDAAGQAKEAVNVLAAIAKGQMPSTKVIFVPFTSITKDNLSQFKK